MDDALGDVVSSPSFTLINQYQKEGLVIRHIDLYRLNDIEMIQRTIDEYTADGDGVVFVEWASVAQGLKDWDVSIDIELTSDPSERKITLETNSEQGGALLEGLVL